ncbi:hypothetical protein BCR32DRAFT_275946 [Anaeromyces robustus]|uniref:Uncharacterized protein n=1 Tax=Anaeromyces robustus TaxID=1754192 RepID=A0A1Y1XJC6_9FUNG|nr:hypothetical protein BCR32DRAFT_275946 [Anaeromyces robustus]|eukprot:ORX85860.1 hypothetical protein BCR32DRAFT_275946 [Anaeromyces robustus]
MNSCTVSGMNINIECGNNMKYVFTYQLGKLPLPLLPPLLLFQKPFIIITTTTLKLTIIAIISITPKETTTTITTTSNKAKYNPIDDYWYIHIFLHFALLPYTSYSRGPFHVHLRMGPITSPPYEQENRCVWGRSEVEPKSFICVKDTP